MTAINACLSVDHRAAYVLTDTAYVRDDGSDLAGTVAQFHPKTLTCPSANMAVALRGRAEVTRWAAQSIATASSIEEVEAVMPSAFRQHYPTVCAVINCDPAATGLEIVVAGWSKADGACRLLFTRHDNGFDFRRVSDLLCPPDTGINELAADPERNLLKAMAAQRATTLMWGNLCIGGAAELTIITKDRIEQRVVKRWPDKIGERIVA